MPFVSLHRLCQLLLLSSLLALAGCGTEGSSGKKKADPVLTSVRSASQHYVELTFDSPVSKSYLDPSGYRISDASGAKLEILEAVPSGESKQTVLLSTALQESAAYQLQAHSLGITTVGFQASSQAEPYVESVISLSDTQLLVSFSERMDRKLAVTPAFYHISDPDSDQDVDIRVTSARIEDDETTVVLTTTPQKNALYELNVANVKARFTCDDGAVSDLAVKSQGAGVCTSHMRPVTTDGAPARYTVAARTGIAQSGAQDPEAAGKTGAVLTSIAGLGAGTATCTGNPCSSAGGGSQDEELIFNFDVPVRADAVVLTQATIGLGAVTLFLSSATSDAYDYKISSAELDQYALGVERSYHLGFCPSVPGDLLIDSIKVRAAEKHNCTSSLCVEDGRRVDPTRRGGNFWGTPREDTVAPTLLSARSVGAHAVLLSFSEPLANTAADPLNFSINPSLTIISAEQTVHETQVLLTTDKQVAARSYEVSVFEVEDRAGNGIDTEANTASFNGSSQDLYLVSATAVSSTEVLVTYSEPMDPLTTGDVRYYHIDDPDGSRDIDIRVIGASPSEDGRSVVLTTTPQDNLQYQLSAINMKALYADEYIDPTRNRVQFWGLPAADDTAPTLQDLQVVDATTLLLTFSEPLSNEAADPANFELTPKLAVIDVEQSAHENQLLLTTKTLSAAEEYTLVVTGVVDRAGNSIDPEAASNTFYGPSQDLFVLSATSLSNTEVLVTFSEPVAKEEAEELGFYHIEDPDSSQDIDIKITDVTLRPDGRSVIVETTPQANLKYELSVVNVKALHSAATVDPKRGSVSFFGLPASDSLPPFIVSVQADGTQTLVVTFSEPVQSDAADPKNFVITGSNASSTVAPQVLSATLSQQETQVVLTTSPLEVGVTYTLTVAGIADRALNPIDPSTASAPFSVVATGDTQSGPRLIGAVSMSNSTVVLRFSRAMNDQAVNPANYWVVQENVNSEAGALALTGARFLDADRFSVELSTRSQNELTYRVSVSNVADLQGNPLQEPRIGLDPTTALFPGTGPGQADLVDSDGDGLNDNVELSGWVVTVTRVDGTVYTREVTSDPGSLADPSALALAGDTDGDGLDDATEKRLGTDPRQSDTDGDMLDDYEEYNITFTDPTMVDTDGDSLDDASEVEYYKTNALVADSDGDGFDDADELFARNRDPRLADIPSHQIIVGNVQLAIDERYTFTDESGATRSESSSTATSMSSANSSRHLVGFGLGVSATVGYDKGWSFSATAEGSVQFESESTVEAASAYERSLEKGREFSQGHAVTREVVGASLGVDFMLENTSDVAFTISNLEITVQAQSPDDAEKLVPVATLVPEGALLTGNTLSLNVGPGQSRGPIHMVNREVIPAMVEDLMRAPRGLVFSVSNFDVSAEDGRNFAFGLQSVRERTVGIYIDSGEGQVEQYQAITAGVLNRPRDEYRCQPTGEHPGALCESDLDCGTSAPCVGGYVVGGFANFDGTGKSQGIPLDFILQDVLQMPRRRPPVLLAGADGKVSTLAKGDDVQLKAVGIAGLAEDEPVVGAGRNMILDSIVTGDDFNPTEYDGIRVGPDKVVASIASGDDIQMIPVGTRGAAEDSLAVSAGPDGVLDTQLRGDDVADTVTGYEVSSTCDAATPFAVVAGVDKVADSTVRPGYCTVVAPNSQRIIGDSCASNAECGTGGGISGFCHIDQQNAPSGSSVPSADSPVITADVDGYLSSVPAKTDAFVGPGVPCSSDADCRVDGVGAGSCSGPQKVVRVGARRDGDYRRFWAITLSKDVQYQSDFGLMRVHAGDSIGLRFIQDLDRDGLSSEVEFLVGSSDFSPDTDGDGLDDFVEVRQGWTVGAVGSVLRRVFSDPRLPDSDRDGLTDLEEADIRPLQCACGALGPENLSSGSQGGSCSTDADCAVGVGCRSTVACTPSDFASGVAECPLCPTDPTTNRTDPRRADSDGDSVSDLDEVFGYKTGAGIADIGRASVIVAGADLRADTLACPQNHCEDDATQHCSSNVECRSRRCIRPVFCDDVQVIERGTSVQSPFAVVVARGPIGAQSGSLVTAPSTGDTLYNAAGFGLDASDPADLICDSRTVGDDANVVALGSEAAVMGVDIDGNETYTCRDGSSFVSGSASSPETGIPLRFPMCLVVRPGPNGVVDSQPGLGDVIIPGGSGQRLEWSDPLDPDTDKDFVRDGFERLLGSSPTDPTDPRLSGDRDGDGLTDGQETSGWTVTYLGTGGVPGYRSVFSNPNVPDSDLDGLPDYAELHMPCFGAVNQSTECPTDPTSWDTDGDGISDFDEVSADLLSDLERFGGFFSGYVLNISDSAAFGTDPNSADSDQDGIEDAEELFGGYRIILPNGSFHDVTSNAALADTDADGLLDGQEKALETDANNPDTDGDGRADGPDSTGVFLATVPDVQVTVRVERIDVNGISDVGGAELGFWVLLRNSRSPSQPQLLASAADASTTAFVHEHTEPNGCHMIDINEPQGTVQLGKELTLVVREGEYFTIDGLIAEFDGESDDCGDPPEYVPSQFSASGCYSRFNNIFNYSDLSSAVRGENIDFNPLSGRVSGGDGCEWDMRTRVTVE